MFSVELEIWSKKYFSRGSCESIVVISAQFEMLFN